jgi:hypothetical protein
MLLSVGLSESRLSAAGSGKSIEVENIRVGFGEKFKVGAWTPIWVQVRGGVERFEGTMEIVSEDESGTATAFAVNAAVDAGDSTRVTGYTRFGTTFGNVVVRFIDKEGNEKGKVSLDALRPNSMPATIFADELVVLAFGRPQGVELLSSIAGLNGNKNAANAPSNTAASVEVIRLQGLDAALLPGRAMGYDSLEAMVIDSNDSEAMNAISGAKAETIKEWVAQGGHLVITVGTNWQKLKDNPLASILPATPVGRTTIDDIHTIEAYAGAKDPLMVATGTGKTRLEITKLEVKDTQKVQIPCRTADSPIVVRGWHGFGRVTLVAIDVDSPPFANWTDRGLFWVKATDLHPTSSGVGAPKLASFNQYGARDLSTKLRETLEQFEGVKLIPFAWVAFFIFVYILMIGPGDYFFLRKVLKRMELTWITFPTMVILVSAIAYIAAYKVKGTELRTNQIDFVDVDTTSKHVRGTSFVGLFSPENHDYEVSVVPKPLTGTGKPVNSQSWISWFSSPEQGLRGMTGSGRGISFGSSGYRYGPTGTAASLKNVRVPIWSTKEFTSRWSYSIDGDPIVESDLLPNGIDRLNGTVTNRLDVPLKNAILAFNTQVYYNLGTLAPGESKTVELTQDRKLSGHLRDLEGSYNDPNMMYRGVVAINRYKLAQAIMFRESEVSGVSIMTSRPLHDLDLTGQLLLDRPMLVAEIDKDLSTLDLGSVSGTTKSSRTTILRVILPLATPARTPKAK